MASIRRRNARWRVMPYACGDSIHDCVVITYQSFGLDRKKQVLRLAFFWLGWPDSDRRMRESKSRALPLGDIPLRSRSAFAPRELNCFYKCQLLTLKFSSTDEVPLSDEFTTEIKVFPRFMVSFSPPIPVITSSAVSFARLHLIGTYLPSDM